MNEEQRQNTESQGTQSQQDESQRQSGSTAWNEVGRQFTLLGQTLSDAIRASWHDPENRKRMQAMQGDLQNMAKDVDRAVRDSANSPHVQRARDEANKAASTLRDAGEETVQEVRPHLLAALKQVNEELRKLVDRMENGNSRPADGGTGSSGGSTGSYGTGSSASGAGPSSGSTGSYGGEEPPPGADPGL